DLERPARRELAVGYVIGHAHGVPCAGGAPWRALGPVRAAPGPGIAERCVVVSAEQRDLSVGGVVGRAHRRPRRRGASRRVLSPVGAVPGPGVAEWPVAFAAKYHYLTA